MQSPPHFLRLTALPLRRRFPALAVVFALAGLLVIPSSRGDETIAATSALNIESGPWGELLYYEVVIRPPTSNLWPGLYEERSLWSFPNLGKVEVKELFDELDFSTELKTLIHNEGKWSTQGTNLELEVNDAIVEQMTAAERLSLNLWWEKNHYDFFQRMVTNFDDKNFTAISQELSPEMLDHLRSVCFLRGNVLSTFDRPYLLRKLSTPEEKRELMRALFTTHSLIGRVKINPGTDIEPIIAYWEAGGRNPGVRSVIEGMRSTEGVDHVDILHLLPPLPRKYMNSFATIQDSGPANAPDCFWTAIQFFRPQSSYRTFDPLPVEHFIIDDFDEVPEPTQFGDLVCLFDKDSRDFIHSYIYVTDNLVFTKNGGSFIRPWVISTMDRMMAIYQSNGEFHRLTFRTKLDR